MPAPIDQLLKPANDAPPCRELERRSAKFERSPDAPTRLSEKLWGRWYPPTAVALSDTVVVEVVDTAVAIAFIQEHYPSIFQADAAWYREATHGSKEVFLERMADLFIIRDGELGIGLLVGNPVDWSTYYVRSLAMLPSYQGRALGSSLSQKVLGWLAAAGVQRVEAEASPSNSASIRTLQSAGFHASGMTLSERWGVLTRWTRFLKTEPENVFLDKFCAGGRLHKLKARGPSISTDHPASPEGRVSSRPQKIWD